MAATDERIRDAILAQIAGAKSVAPRDIALVLAAEGEDWRKYLSRIRAECVSLHSEGKLLFIHKKKIVSPEGLKGIYRLAGPDYQGAF